MESVINYVLKLTLQNDFGRALFISCDFAPFMNSFFTLPVSGQDSIAQK